MYGHDSSLVMVGYLKWIENCAFRREGIRGSTCDEFSVGDETPIYDLDHHRIQWYIRTGCVELFDPNMKPTTIEKLRAAQHKQQRVVVPKVKASKRPVLKRVKK